MGGNARRKIEGQEKRSGFAMSFIGKSASRPDQDQKASLPVYFDLTGDYTCRLDDYYRLLEGRYQQHMQAFRIANKVISVFLAVALLGFIACIVGALFNPHLIDLLLGSGAIALVIALGECRVNTRYHETLENIVAKFSRLYDFYLELFRINEIVDAQQRGEKIDELLRNKPFLREIPFA
ncbi:MAG: hypothetical protein H0W02_06775 [Ktedonobacteraceae bacterium]|nr:hypothetical protein [Ktedonobacteraceae bacterium]